MKLQLSTVIALLTLSVALFAPTAHACEGFSSRSLNHTYSGPLPVDLWEYFDSEIRECSSQKLRGVVVTASSPDSTGHLTLIKNYVPEGLGAEIGPELQEVFFSVDAHQNRLVDDVYALEFQLTGTVYIKNIRLLYGDFSAPEEKQPLPSDRTLVVHQFLGRSSESLWLELGAASEYRELGFSAHDGPVFLERITAYYQNGAVAHLNFRMVRPGQEFRVSLLGYHSPLVRLKITANKARPQDRSAVLEIRGLL